MAEMDDLDDTISRIERLPSSHEQVDEYDRLIEGFPRHPELYFRRGMSRNVLGDKQGAIKDMTQVIALNPAEPAAFYFRGQFSLDERNFREAITDLEQAIACDGRLDSTYYAEPARLTIAVASLHLADFKRALRECEGLKADASVYVIRRLWTLDEVLRRAKSRSYPA